MVQFNKHWSLIYLRKYCTNVIHVRFNPSISGGSLFHSIIPFPARDALDLRPTLQTMVNMTQLLQVKYEDIERVLWKWQYSQRCNFIKLHFTCALPQSRSSRKWFCYSWRQVQLHSPKQLNWSTANIKKAWCLLRWRRFIFYLLF